MASLKRSSSNAGNKANHPNKRIQIKPHEPSKRYVYVVVQDWQADSYAKIVTKYKGSYASLVDANNRVLQLWYHPEDTEAGPEDRQESAIEGKHADGTLWWRDSGEQFEGEMIHVRIQKHEVLEDTGANANAWGDMRPSRSPTSGHPYSYYG